MTIVGRAFSAKSSSKERPFSSATGANDRSSAAELLGHRHLGDVQVHLPGLDLREVEDVVDQPEQLGARVVDRVRELDLLVGQVAARVVAEQLRQDQQRVERRPQLVRHVREELGLVARRERELLRLLLQRLPRLLDLGVLDLDPAVLLLELLRALLELLVRLLQLLLLGLQQLLGRAQRRRLRLELGVRAPQLVLLRLQLLGLALQVLRQRLRLEQQLLGARVRVDRVQDDADRLRELVEERLLDLGERRERGELDHGHHRLLEQDREDDDARRRGLAETRRDLDVVLGRLRDHDRLPLQRGLADQRLADLEAVRDRLALLVAVGRDQAQLGLLVLAGVLGDVERAVMGGDERRHLAHQQPGDRLLVALALQHPGEAGEVRVEPVLRGVALGRLAQVADHLVDVVLEVRDLAGRLDRDRAGQVALGHRRRHVRDRAQLRRQRLGELVDVVGQALPHAGDALDLSLDAELALGADLLGDAGDLGGEGRELVDHRVDRPGELGRPRPSPRR